MAAHAVMIRITGVEWVAARADTLGAKRAVKSRKREAAETADGEKGASAASASASKALRSASIYFSILYSDYR